MILSSHFQWLTGEIDHVYLWLAVYIKGRIWGARIWVGLGWVSCCYSSLWCLVRWSMVAAIYHVAVINDTNLLDIWSIWALWLQNIKYYSLMLLLCLISRQMKHGDCNLSYISQGFYSSVWYLVKLHFSVRSISLYLVCNTNRHQLATPGIHSHC